MKSFWPPLMRSLRSVRALRRYGTAILTLRRLINKKGSNGGRTHLSHLATQTAGLHFLSLLYSYDKLGWGTLLIVAPENKTLLSFDIDSLSRYRRWLLYLPRGTLDLYYDAKGGEGQPTFYALGVNALLHKPKTTHAKIGSLATCAAIATYPQRREMLKDAVASLAGQVDHLFVYLNNYREPPSFLLKKKYENNVHFVLDTNSEYRAAAKFYWLCKHRCYWLLCDDDIVYPRDYVKLMKAKIDQYGRQAIVGVHGVIFEQSSQAHLLHHRILFERALRCDSEVHMLGTGTIAFHSSILSSADCRRLLRYPVANDEALAVISRARGIRQIAVERRPYWLRSNHRMNFGIFEETQLLGHQSQQVTRILECGTPWSTLALPDELKAVTNQ